MRESERERWEEEKRGGSEGRLEQQEKKSTLSLVLPYRKLSTWMSCSRHCC